MPQISFQTLTQGISRDECASRGSLCPILLGTITIFLVTCGYLHNLGTNPNGVFCDEAMIGLKARDLMAGTFPDGTYSLFYTHFGTVAGSLPVYATAPFVWLFGLDAFSLRLASAFFTIATAITLWKTFRLLRLSAPWLPALIFLLSPVVIHIGRINFGHAPSIFLLSLGYYLYLKGRTAHRPLAAACGGACFGLAAYGYPGFYVAVPIFLTILIASEFVWIARTRDQTAPLLAMWGAAFLAYLPILFEAQRNPLFSARFEAKDQGSNGLLSYERITNMIENYPKYFSIDFLFRKGETGLPNVFIQRHSVTGSGLLPWIALPFLVIGILALILSHRDHGKRPFVPFLWLAFLFPLPDLITTRWNIAPYTFSSYTGILCVPFLLACGLATLDRYRQTLATTQPGTTALIARRIIQPSSVLSVLLISASVFIFSTYALYPNVSSGVWGWQSGPEAMVTYFSKHQDQFRSLTIESRFNETPTLIDFFAQDETLRRKIAVGLPKDPTTLEPIDLYGISNDTFKTMPPEAWTIHDTVFYPDGSPAFYLVTVRHGP